jgi:flagellar biosynthesis/type III secretory pathway M-ring protein FliF/YscJ
VPKQLLLMIGGLIVASMIAVAGLLAFVLPSDIFEPTTAQRAEEAAEEEAEAEEGADEDDAADTGEGTDALEQDPAEDAPGTGTDDETVGEAEPGGEDTGEVEQETDGS